MKDNFSTVIELFREDMKFSAAHFTIFSKTERENLHGHNFRVYAAITSRVVNNAMAFNYSFCRKKILELCNYLNEKFLLPSLSPYLKIEKQNGYCHFWFGETQFLLPEKDILLLSLENITTESLAKWFVDTIAKKKNDYGLSDATSIVVKISTGSGQYASATHSLKEVCNG